MVESEEEIKTFFMKVKEESEKAGLKLNIQKTKIMASGPITAWQIENSGNSGRLYFWGSKITADGDCSLEKMLSLWKKIYDKPRQCIKKLRHHFANKGPYSQSYSFGP